MRLHLDGRTTGALDEGLHRLDVLASAVRRRLPVDIYEHVIRVVAGEDALPVPCVPAREVELVHPLEIARYGFVGHDGCLLFQVASWRPARARSASRCWRRSSYASEPGGAAASERVAWATMASAMERSPAGLGYASRTSC